MRRAILVAVALALAGCGGDDAVAPAGPAAAKVDQFCTMAGLASPPRTTVVLVDAQAITASPPEKFREANPALFALVIGLGDPERAVETGAVAPRERITLLIGDPVTGTIKPLFTGCVPGLSQAELAARAAGGEDGALSTYFGSDIASQMAKSRDDFRKSLLVSLLQAKPGAKASAPESFAASSLARLVRGLGAGSSADREGVRRLFVFTNPAASIPESFASSKLAREAGFAAGEQIAADLGRSEAYLVPASGAVSDVNAAFLDAFFLASGADLRRAGGFSADGLSPAPVRIYAYTGELPLSPEVRSPLDIRLAVTASGALVNSWIAYSATRGVRATPIAGQFDCGEDETCVLRGDPNGGLGQRWRTEPGSAPQPLLGGPFGGLRMIEGRDRGGHLTGRIFDPIIYVGTAGDLKFDARRAADRTGNPPTPAKAADGGKVEASKL